MFQFHSGSIKSIAYSRACVIQLMFQFHSGSIKSAGAGHSRAFCQRFQFHSGSIKSVLPVRCKLMWSLFQFHSGSIKRRAFSVSVTRAHNCFNSIVVRLKVCDEQCKCCEGPVFQFHSGSIKRNTRDKNLKIWYKVSIP